MTRPCAYCRRPFQPRRADHMYCSKACTQKQYRKTHSRKTYHPRTIHSTREKHDELRALNLQHPDKTIYEVRQIYEESLMTGIAGRMAYLRKKASKTIRLARCVGCREHVQDGEPIVHCGRRKFLCAPCSNAKRSATCRCCRHKVSDMFFYRVKFSDKAGLICANCREKSNLEGVPSNCRGCLQEIPAGEPLVYCGILRCVCVACAEAARPVYCKGCHRTLTGVYVYLHRYAGATRNTVCEWCLADIKAGVRRPLFDMAPETT